MIRSDGGDALFALSNWCKAEGNEENYSKCEKCLTELLQIIFCNETDAVYTHINYNWSEML